MRGEDIDPAYSRGDMHFRPLMGVRRRGTRIFTAYLVEPDTTRLKIGRVIQAAGPYGSGSRFQRPVGYFQETEDARELVSFSSDREFLRTCRTTRMPCRSC